MYKELLGLSGGSDATYWQVVDVSDPYSSFSLSSKRMGLTGNSFGGIMSAHNKKSLASVDTYHKKNGGGAADVKKRLNSPIEQVTRFAPENRIAEGRMAQGITKKVLCAVFYFKFFNLPMEVTKNEY